MSPEMEAATEETIYDLEIDGDVYVTGGLGIFGTDPPGSQPATPTGTDSQKIAAIISILQGAGLCA